jgi:hypothetical protein
MAYLINPKCGLPIYTLENKDTAVHCGKISGYIWSVILTIFIIITALYIYYGNMFDKKNNKKRYIFYTSISLTLALIWGVFPSLNGWMNGRNWLVYDEQIGSYMKNGMTRDIAIQKVQELYQTSVQSSAISNIATALLISRR